MDGILVIDKPKGMTSHDVVDFLRKKFGLKKVGHAGTLDPMATGVLVMLIGKYTKLSGELIKDDKEYEAVVHLGGRSDTGDGWGKIEASGVKADFTPDELARVLSGFQGEIEQATPMYSAVKVGGKKLYELARKGVKIDTPTRSITIESIELVDVKLPEVRFRVRCSKGTYIRQLASDIGDKLGCGGYLSELKRTRSGQFMIEAAVSVEDLKGMSIGEVEKILINPKFEILNSKQT